MVSMLKIFRILRQLSLLRLYSLSGIPPGRLSQIEKGMRPATPPERKLLAMCLQVEEEFLFSEDGALGLIIQKGKIQTGKETKNV